MEFTEQEISLYYTSRAPGLKTAGATMRGPCPVHNGKDANFSVEPSTGLCYCHSQCGRGWDVLSLEQELHSCDFVSAKRLVFEFLGRPEPTSEERDIEAQYDYTDEKGTVLYQVVRKTGKRFMQRHSRPGGGWSWGLKDVRIVPYRLPQLLSKDCVWIVEGEKDVRTLERLGFTATCNNGGAGNFRPELAQYFKGKDVAILPDNDTKGRQHALRVAELLYPVAATVRVIEIPELPEKGDATDFVRAGGTYQQLCGFYAAAQEWTPEWDFSSDVPHPDDKYIHTLPSVVSAAGGLDRFWDYTLAAGVPTPFNGLTHALAGGMRPREVYILGGNQGSGKTSLALQFVAKAARSKAGVLMFSMEMSERDVFHRILASEARVNLLDFQTMQRHHESVDTSRAKLDEATRRYWHLPIRVSTKPAVSPDYIASEVVRHSGRRPVGLVVVDHMQLMSSSGKGIRGDYEKFTNISRCMKQAAVEANVPILVVSQTSRSNARLAKAELEESDLRGSGALEEDACAVMMLFPDAADKKRAETDGSFSWCDLKAWLKLAKNRYGMSGMMVPLKHSKQFTRFDLLEADNA
ncbi:MAG: DnaB-like helicase C-terminal domain-containing protein [Candidatus Sulfotelmatobacter sp.]